MRGGGSHVGRSYTSGSHAGRGNGHRDHDHRDHAGRGQAGGNYPRRSRAGGGLANESLALHDNSNRAIVRRSGRVTVSGDGYISDDKCTSWWKYK